MSTQAPEKHRAATAARNHIGKTERKESDREGNGREGIFVEEDVVPVEFVWVTVAVVMFPWPPVVKFVPWRPKPRILAIEKPLYLNPATLPDSTAPATTTSNTHTHARRTTPLSRPISSLTSFMPILLATTVKMTMRVTLLDGR
jgi:hypothetical protein